jgi:hypothetical protein
MKVVRLSALRTSRFYPQKIPLILIYIRGWVDPRKVVRLEGLNRWKISVTQPEFKPATNRLAAPRINSNVSDDYDDNHNKLQVACLLAENRIRIRNTAFHCTKSFDRIFIWETARFSLWTLFFHMCLTVSSSVRSLACNDTSENNRNSVLQIAVSDSFYSFLLEHHKH